MGNGGWRSWSMAGEAMKWFSRGSGLEFSCKSRKSPINLHKKVKLRTQSNLLNFVNNFYKKFAFLETFYENFMFHNHLLCFEMILSFSEFARKAKNFQKHRHPSFRIPHSKQLTLYSIKFGKLKICFTQDK